VVVLPTAATTVVVVVDTGGKEIRVGVMRVFLARLAGGPSSTTVAGPGLQGGVFGSDGSGTRSLVRCCCSS
jgi:hypothetical protein